MNIMRSTEKTVLMVQHAHGKGTATYPVSVHVNKAHADSVKAHANSLIKSGDVEAVKAMFPTFKTTEDGKLPSSVKWATLRLPYAPSLPESADNGDDFEI